MHHVKVSECESKHLGSRRKLESRQVVSAQARKISVVGRRGQAPSKDALVVIHGPACMLNQKGIKADYEIKGLIYLHKSLFFKKKKKEGESESLGR